ncbi:MAG: hypothetical protein GWN17_04500 [Candidatus Korarchaeota archaeon]|nr:hypothetical protein [Candidatus Thorarchaeota archaeon]NIW51476.1 hypothetical protein [Candidatus Korarchaeota archaeon]
MSLTGSFHSKVFLRVRAGMVYKIEEAFEEIHYQKIDVIAYLFQKTKVNWISKVHPLRRKEKSLYFKEMGLDE